MNSKITTFFIAFTLTLTTGSAFAINWNNVKIGPGRAYDLASMGSTVATSVLTGFKAPFSPASIVASATVYALFELQKASPWKGILFQPGKNVNLPAPSGWTDPNTPPSTSPTSILWKDANNQPIPSSQDACQTFASLYGLTITSIQAVSPTRNKCIVNSNYYWYSDAVISCPTGYTNNNGTCILSNPTAVKWPSDSKSTYYQDTSSNWQPHPRDPDTITDGPTGSNEFTTQGTDEYGNPIKESYKTRPDGGTEYNRWTQTVNNNGQDTVYKETIVFNSDGQITNIYNNTYNNQTLDQVTPTTPADQPIKVELPQITVSGDGGQLNKTLPQTETAEAALTRLKAHIATNSIIAPLLNPSAASGTCPMFLQVNMGTFGNHSTNVMCDLYELMIPTLDVVTKFAWSLAAILIFFSA